MPESMPNITFRPVAPDESLDDMFDLDDLAFHDTTGPVRRAQLSERIDRRETLCAYDGERLVGSSLIWPHALSVPGGQLPCGAVSWVSVAPTHRRRGLLRTMMEGQLTRLVQAGTPLAALWASEATIYGRFGFEVATWAHSYDISLRDRSSGITPAGPGGGPSVRLLDPMTARHALAEVYDRASQQRAGVLTRDEAWWTLGVLVDPGDERDGEALRLIGVGEPLTGYAFYRVGRDDTAASGARAILSVKELVATDSDAARALWSYLLSVDLAGRLSAPLRPTDDPLSLMLNDPRTAKRTAHDALWIRLLDVPRALESRQWSGPIELVLEVQDELVPANSGRWRLSSAEGQTQCVPTDRPADLALSVAQLAAIYLGGGSLQRTADAGLINEPTPGSAARLDHAARTLRAPWNVAVF